MSKETGTIAKTRRREEGRKGETTDYTDGTDTRVNYQWNPCNPWFLNILRGLCIIGLTLVCGCAGRPATISSWKQTVEEYVWKEGNGDPGVLRQVTWNATDKGFSVLGGDLPEKSTDVHGVLLGHRPIGGKPWFVFLVGQVEKRNVKDIRLAAMSWNGKAEWKVSGADTEALGQYRQYRERMAKEAAATNGSKVAVPFPGGEDVFELGATGNRAEAVHKQSGARWGVGLP